MKRSAFAVRREVSFAGFVSLSFFVVSTALLCFLLPPVSAGAEDWPRYRHSVTGDGATPDKATPPLALQWQFVPAHEVYPAWPMPSEEMPRKHTDNAYHAVAAEGAVFFGSSENNHVYAVAADTGELRWTFAAEGPVRFAPSFYKGRLFVGSDDGYVYCLDAAKGQRVWRYRPGPSNEKILGNGRMISVWPVRTSVLVEEDGNGQAIVYYTAGVFPFEGLQIGALRASDGSEVWKNDTLGDRTHELEFGGISPHGYLVASDTVLYVPSGRAMPAAFDKKTGAFLYYCKGTGKRGGSWALVMDNTLIAGVDKSGVPEKVEFDSRTGGARREVFAQYEGMDMAVSPSHVYLLNQKGVHAIDRKMHAANQRDEDALRSRRKTVLGEIDDLRKKQRKGAKGNAEAPAGIQALTKERAEIDRQIASLDKTALQWRCPAEDLNCLIATGDTVFAGGKGRVIGISRTTGEKVWEAKVDGTVRGLAAAGGRLIASSDTGEALCFGAGVASQAKTIRQVTQPVPFPRDEKTAAYEAAAETILKETGIRKGYCLVLDCGEGRLAFELAKRSDLEIIGIETDPAKAAEARRKLSAAGLLGSRIVVENWDLADLPDYFANLIVSDAAVMTGRLSQPPEAFSHALRPCGGVVCITLPPEGPSKETDARKLGERLQAVRIPAERKFASRPGCVTLTAGKLEGAGSWTGLYGNAQNTACSDDQLVRGPFGVLWYGNPGPVNMVERHARAVSPVSMDGRLFIQGEEIVMAYDAYNGGFLWEKRIPGAVRVRADVDGGNLALASDGLYVAAFNKCYRLDPATGETVRVFALPPSADKSRRWGYVARDGKILFGTASFPLQREYAAVIKDFRKDGKWLTPDEMPMEVVEKWGGRAAVERIYRENVQPCIENMENAGRSFERGGEYWRTMAAFPAWDSQTDPKTALTEKIMAGDLLFALDPESGGILWERKGRRIPHVAIAFGEGPAKGRLFYADDAENAAREQAVERRKALARSGAYVPAPESELDASQADVRKVTALDGATGAVVWEKTIDLTGCGGDKMSAAYAGGLLLFYGSFSNHDGKFFRANELAWRRVTALDAATGEVVWSRPLNYLRRPLVIGDAIIVEPRACDLKTGEIRMRTHPVTGEKTPWEFLRPGHCCSTTSAAPNAFFFRSYWTAFYEWTEDRGLSLFGGIRPGCWLNIISANGLLLMPEASAGCTCSFPVRCSVVWKNAPRKKPGDWTVFIAQGDMTPVRRLAVNLGAPGDMRDQDGALWFAYPRPNTVSNTGYGSYGVKFDLQDKTLEGMGYYVRDYRGKRFEGTDKPWLFASGCEGLSKCLIPLIDPSKNQQPGVYTVRLGFMAPREDQPGARVFAVQLQGKTVEAGLDIVREAGGAEKAIVREYTGIRVSDNLTLELASKRENPGPGQAPLLQSIEIIREDGVKVGTAD